MLVGLCPSTEQIRHYAQSALNGFGDLDADDAIENARSEIGGLIAYLDALALTNDTVPVLGLRVVNGKRRLVTIGRDAHVNNPADLKVVR